MTVLTLASRLNNLDHAFPFQAQRPLGRPRFSGHLLEGVPAASDQSQALPARPSRPGGTPRGIGQPGLQTTSQGLFRTVTCELGFRLYTHPLPPGSPRGRFAGLIGSAGRFASWDTWYRDCPRPALRVRGRRKTTIPSMPSERKARRLHVTTHYGFPLPGPSRLVVWSDLLVLCGRYLPPDFDMQKIKSLMTRQVSGGG